eukprot:jgi/Psemu1/16149/gm1.16149_g
MEQHRRKSPDGPAVVHENDNGADLLDEFFAEIERLTIIDLTDENNDSTDHFCRTVESNQSSSHDQNQNCGLGDFRNPYSKQPESQKTMSHQEKQQQQQQKNAMIDQADEKRNTWTKFSISQSSAASSTTSTSRKPISFSLNTGKKKAKKLSSTQTEKISRRQENVPAVSLGFGDDCDPSAPVPFSQQQTTQQRPPLFFQYHMLPRWIAVIDTCALLESFGSVCDIIDLAKQAQAGASAPTNANMCFESITIVIPYTVWDELDYRSKEIDDEHHKYKARRAARLLTDELKQLQKQQQHLPQEEGSSITDNYNHQPSILRTQSRSEAHRATDEFLFQGPSSSSGSINNDDRILACALHEQQQFLVSPCPSLGHSTTKRNSVNTTVTTLGTITAGGVTLITSDKVLSGKARAEKLLAYAPVEFVRYYNKRMASFWSVTTRNSTNKNTKLDFNPYTNNLASDSTVIAELQYGDNPKNCSPAAEHLLEVFTEGNHMDHTTNKEPEKLEINIKTHIRPNRRLLWMRSSEIWWFDIQLTKFERPDITALVHELDTLDISTKIFHPTMRFVLSQQPDLQAVELTDIQTYKDFINAIQKACEANKNTIKFTFGSLVGFALSGEGVPTLQTDQLHTFERTSNNDPYQLIPQKLQLRKLQGTQEWDGFLKSKWKPLNRYHKVGMFGDPTPQETHMTVLPCWVWAYLNKEDPLTGNIIPKFRDSCNGGKRYGKAVTLAETYAACIKQPAHQLTWALAAALNLIFNVPFQQWWTECLGRDPIPVGHIIPINKALHGHPESSHLWDKYV